MASGLTQIDWSAPWLQPWRQTGQMLADAIVASPASGCAVLNGTAERAATPVRFVAQAALPRHQAYEDFVARHAQVPTREGLHDFFNALCWVQFPKTKLLLNRVHAAELARSGVPAQRGAVRDGATLFDENGAVFMGPRELWQALQARQWQRLFVDLRGLWGQAQMLLWGHALLEKLVQPRPAITAHVLRGPEQVVDIEALDTWLAENVSADTLAGKPFAPMPVLGVPGWCSANAHPDFYADERVFRPAVRTAPP